MNLWAESEIIENEGKRYLNREATKRFLRAYNDRIKISLAPDDDPDDVLISYDYATRVVRKHPVDTKLESFSLQDFLGRGPEPVDKNNVEFPIPTDSSEKQLPMFVPQEEFIANHSESFYTPEELKLIEYFKKEGKVDLLKIPQILKGHGFSVDKLIEYGRLLSRALPWYTFTSNDEQELIDSLNKIRIEKFELETLISASKSLDEIIDVLKAYKKFGNGTCSESNLTDAILDFLSRQQIISDDEVKKFWDNLSNDDVFEGLYLKSYFSRIQPFSSIIEPNINDSNIVDINDSNIVDINDSDIVDIDLSSFDGSVITLDDLNNFDKTKIYDNVKEYIEKYLMIHSGNLDLKIGKIEWTKQFIDVIYNEFEINDNQVLLNTLYQSLADREPLNISRSDISEAFKQFKLELENSNDDDIKDKIAKCINFGNPYHELLKIYENSSIDKWSKYDEYVIMYIKDKIDYSNELGSKNERLLHIRSLGIVILDIKKFSDTKQTDTFKSLASSLNMTEKKLYQLVLNYSMGIGDPIEDFGLKKDEPQKDNNESFTIKKRRKPKTKQEIKKYIFAALAGAGIISCLYLTVALGRNPITVIKNCATTFRALFSGNSSLAALGASMGNLTAYFGSAIAAIGSGIKLGKIIASEDDIENVNQDSSEDSKPLYEEIEPSGDYDDQLDNIVDEINNKTSDDEDIVDLTDTDFSTLMEDDNSLYGKRR